MTDERSKRTLELKDYAAVLSNLRRSYVMARLAAPKDDEDAKLATAMLSELSNTLRNTVIDTVSAGAQTPEAKEKYIGELKEAEKAYRLTDRDKARASYSHSLAYTNAKAYLHAGAKNLLSCVPSDIITQMLGDTEGAHRQADQQPELIAASIWHKHTLLKDKDFLQALHEHNRARNNMIILGNTKHVLEKLEDEKYTPEAGSLPLDVNNLALFHETLTNAQDEIAHPNDTGLALQMRAAYLCPPKRLTGVEIRDFAHQVTTELLSYSYDDQARKINNIQIKAKPKILSRTWENKHKIERDRAVATILEANLEAFTKFTYGTEPLHEGSKPLEKWSSVSTLDLKSADMFFDTLKDIVSDYTHETSTHPHIQEEIDALANHITKTKPYVPDEQEGYLSNAMSILLRGIDPHALKEYFSSKQIGLMFDDMRTPRDYANLAHVNYATNKLLYLGMEEEYSTSLSPEPVAHTIEPEITESWNILRRAQMIQHTLNDRFANGKPTPTSHEASLQLKERYAALTANTLKLEKDTASLVFQHESIPTRYLQATLDAYHDEATKQFSQNLASKDTDKNDFLSKCQDKTTPELLNDLEFYLNQAAHFIPHPATEIDTSDALALFERIKNNPPPRSLRGT